MNHSTTIRVVAAVIPETEIFRDHYRASRDTFLEFVRLDGTDFPAPQGTAVVRAPVGLSPAARSTRSKR